MKITPEMIDAALDATDFAKSAASRKWMKRAITAALSPAPVAADELVGAHPDDIAVDRFASAMKAKLAEKRAQGYGGWDRPDECTIAFLSELLRKHVGKGDPVDVGNFAMMIHQRGGIIE